jgi:cytochrome P450
MVMDSQDEAALLAFDPKADDFMDNPWEFYRRLRVAAPVFRDPRHDIFFVTRYDLVDQVLKDAQRFSSQVDRASMRRGGLPPKVLEIRAQGWPLALTMSQNDTPSHDVFRSLVSPFFTPRNLESIEPFVRARAQALVDALPLGVAVDVVPALAVPLPIAVIGRYLGMQEYGEITLKRWSDAFADEIGMLTSEDRAVEIAQLTLDCHRAMLALCEARRRSPRDDIISHIARARIDADDGQRALTDGELLSMLTQMLVAGNETTTNTLAAGVLRLAETPGLLQRLRGTPELLPRFVEELLRLESPVQGQFRRALRDTELGGVNIPAGSLLHVRLASANRDEAAFGEHAEQVNLDGRPPAPHKAFGAGMHFCLGAMLSRLELKLAFELISRSIRSIELAVPRSDIHFHTHFHLRGLESLPVVLG